MAKVRTIDDFTAQELKMMPKTARPIGVPPISPKDFAEKYSNRVRHGKTKKDKTRKVKHND